MIFAVGYFPLYAYVSEHKVLRKHIFYIIVYLTNGIYVFIHFYKFYTNLANTPFTKDAESSVPNFFASSTASLIDTLTGISSSNLIS